MPTKIDIYKHALYGSQLWAVPAGSDLWRQVPEMAAPRAMKMLKLYRAAVELGTPLQLVFDHTQVRADIERQGWAKISQRLGS